MSVSSPKPKSMAAAVAAYTGKKYLTKAEKKLKKKHEKEQKYKYRSVAVHYPNRSSSSNSSRPKKLQTRLSIVSGIPSSNDNGIGERATNNGPAAAESELHLSSSTDEEDDGDQAYEPAVDEVTEGGNSDSEASDRLRKDGENNDFFIDISSNEEESCVGKRTRKLLYEKEMQSLDCIKLQKTNSIALSPSKGRAYSEKKENDSPKSHVGHQKPQEDKLSGHVSPFSGKADHSNLSIDDSDDDHQQKRINDKIELKKLASNHDLKGINQEIISAFDKQSAQGPQGLSGDKDSTANLAATVSTHKKSRSSSPNKLASTASSTTSLSEMDHEFLYGQNIDFTDSDFYQIEEDPKDRGSNNSQKIWKNWQAHYLSSRPVGLLNLGVTCYTNAAIQAMIHIPAIQHYLKDVHEHKCDSLINNRSVTLILAAITSKMWKTKQQQQRGEGAHYINPKKLIKKLGDINCMMSEWQQEDSHEYFMSLLSRLQEDSTPKKQKLNTSIIYDIFGGLLNQAVVCKSCNQVSKTQQEFYDLSLSLDPKKKRKITPGLMNSSRMNSKEPTPEPSVPGTPQAPLKESSVGTDANDGSSETASAKAAKQKPRYSVINAINDFFEPEIIKPEKSDKSSGYACSNCKQTTTALKFSSIARAPETLVIHIKRFRFNGINSSSSKLKVPVSYPLILDLADFENEDLVNFEKNNPKKVSSASDEHPHRDSEENDPMRYRLISVVVHEGRSISSGHYVAHCRQPSGEWCTYDDEYINTISEKQVLKEPNAYYLIYSRLKYKSDKSEIGSKAGTPESVANGKKRGSNSPHQHFNKQNSKRRRRN